jgi:NAD(P)-dependent dehydrogenase (short-subunit alcohol dehydrogenase family)
MTTPKPLNRYQPKHDLLKDKVILITGAGSGIGAAVARACAASGATVILLGKTVNKLEQLYDDIVAAGHPEPAIYPMDLMQAREEHYQQLAEVIDKEFGRLDGLVHNAGLLGSLTPLANHSTEQWVKVMQVNLHAPYLMTQACLPLLKKADSASIIFVTSSVGRKGRAYWGAYAASKAACENLMQTLADEQENTTNIRVNSLNPGATRTAMRRIAFPGEDPNTLPEPAAIAPAFVYLLGADSKEITGQQLDAQ